MTNEAFTFDNGVPAEQYVAKLNDIVAESVSDDQNAETPDEKES